MKHVRLVFLGIIAGLVTAVVFYRMNVPWPLQECIEQQQEDCTLYDNSLFLIPYRTYKAVDYASVNEAIDYIVARKEGDTFSVESIGRLSPMDALESNKTNNWIYGLADIGTDRYYLLALYKGGKLGTEDAKFDYMLLRRNGETESIDVIVQNMSQQYPLVANGELRIVAVSEKEGHLIINASFGWDSVSSFVVRYDIESGNMTLLAPFAKGDDPHVLPQIFPLFSPDGDRYVFFDASGTLHISSASRDTPRPLALLNTGETFFSYNCRYREYDIEWISENIIRYAVYDRNVYEEVLGGTCGRSIGSLPLSDREEVWDKLFIEHRETMIE